MSVKHQLVSIDTNWCPIDVNWHQLELFGHELMSIDTNSCPIDAN